jgi:DNA processing protein
MTDATVASPVAAQYLRLHLADGIGPVYLGRLIQAFKTLDAVLGASETALCAVEGIGTRRARAIRSSRHDPRVEQELERAAERGVRIICWEDEEYPRQLRHCADPPICLYVRGRLQKEDAVAIGVVGSRHCSHYGTEQARRFGALLAGAGFTVVSGLARGIDGCAHEGALAATGRTVAVLGCGVDLVYPPEHAALAERVLASGALLSEEPLGSPPTADSFPRRNRIIAGMSLGVLVVEASERSGALITARLAGEYNREVFALPGRVDVATSVGTNGLIRSGAAKLVTGLQDILDELGEVGRLMGAPAAPPEAEQPTLFSAAALGPQERAIADCLGQDELHVDQIVARCGLTAAQVAAQLTMLQLKGVIAALPGNRYVLRRGETRRRG